MKPNALERLVASVLGRPAPASPPTGPTNVAGEAMPAFAATTGLPQAMASSMTRPKVSLEPACTSASHEAIQAASSHGSRRYGMTVTFAAMRPSRPPPMSSK